MSFFVSENEVLDHTLEENKERSLDILQVPLEGRNQGLSPFSLQSSEYAIVFFDLETGGLDILRYEILQIVLKIDMLSFETYITPNRSIDLSASQVNGLNRVGRKLYQNGILVESLPKELVMLSLLEFLKNLKKNAYLSPITVILMEND